MKSGVEDLVLNWNKLAMDNLREEKFVEAFRLLQKAEELLRYPDGSDNDKLQAITFNNFGCFYKKTEKYMMALKYLFKALDVKISSVYDKTNLAGTHLNICAVFSLMSQHDKALTHGIMAIKLLKEANEMDKSNSTLVSLIVSLNNTGLEYEYLKEMNKALSTYKCGMDLAIKQLGPDHPISCAIYKSYYGLASKNPSKTFYSNISLKSTQNNFSVQKKNSSGLPTINMLNIRNKSVGSRGKLNSNRTDKRGNRVNSNKAFSDEQNRNRANSNKTFNDEQNRNRANSNKTFSEEQNRKKQLPIIEKPKTVAKREKKVLNDSKVKGLENKITELQNQIFLYQEKYKQLEANTYDVQMDKSQAATVIQRYWRKKHLKPVKLSVKVPKLPSDSKTLAIIKELEMFKQNSPNSTPSCLVPKPPIFIKSKESHLIPISPKKVALNNRLCKTIAIPLDPIRESKIETKEMKAVLIQAHIRKFLARSKFLQKRQASIKIQRAYRKHQCQRLFTDIKAAIICIQRHWRKFRQGKNAKFCVQLL